MSAALQTDATEALDQLKLDLALGYRILAQAGLGTGLLAHLTARLPGAETFWTYQFGQSAEEVRVADLREADFLAQALDGTSRVNPTLRLHGDLYRARPDVTCIVHHHGDNCIAMGAIGANLEPFDRNAGRWHGEVDIIEDYDSVYDISQQGIVVAEALGTRKALLLKHHGVLVTGPDIRDAIVATIELERSFGVQLKAMAAGRLHLMPPGEIAESKRFLASRAFADGTWSWLRRSLARAGLDHGVA